jgi:hypothetical protein
MAYRDDVEALTARRGAIARELETLTKEREGIGRELVDMRVASPCSEAWDEMAGDDRVRHCGACRQHVYNLSGMTRAEAEALIRERNGNLCVRFYERADGTVLLRDCSVGRVRTVGKVALAIAAGAIVGGVATAAIRSARADDTDDDRWCKPGRHTVGKYEGGPVTPEFE